MNWVTGRAAKGEMKPNAMTPIARKKPNARDFNTIFREYISIALTINSACSKGVRP